MQRWVSRGARPADGRKRFMVAGPRFAFVLATLFGALLSATSWAGTKFVYVPEPNVSTYAIGSTSYTGPNLSGTCNPVTPTNATITVQPVHGTLSIQSGTITPEQCPGQPLPGTLIYYTWTDTSGSPGSGTDAFHVHFSSTTGTIDTDVFLFMGAYGKELGDKHPRVPCSGIVCDNCRTAAGCDSAANAGNDNGDAPEDPSGTMSSDGQVYAGEPAGGGLGSAPGGGGGAYLRARNPIQANTGNVFYNYTDYTTAGPNPLAFTRYYNSQANIESFAVSFVGNTATNRNWRSNFDRYINALTPNVAAVERPDGQVLDFFLVGSTWTPDTDVDYKLTQSGSTWTLTGPDDTVETYTTGVTPISGAAASLNAIASLSAHLTSIKSRNGYTQTLNYTGGGLTSVTDSYGRSLAFTYNADGTLASVTTPDNTTITYGYTVGPLLDLLTSGQQLSTVTFPTTPAQVITYNYTQSGLPFALSSVTDEDGTIYESWTYDAQGRGLTHQLGNGVGLTTLVYGATTTTVTSALGVTDTYTLTTLQNVPKITTVSRAATGTTAAATRTVTYDANGYVATATDWNGNETSYTNNAHGLPTSITDGVGTALARTATVVYDATFVHLPDSVASPGVTRGYTYDASGNTKTVTLTDTTTTSSPYATSGQIRTWTNTWSNFLLASTKTPNGYTTSLGYDASGALVSVTDPLNHVTSITMHTGGGLPQVIVDPNNVTTTLTYDPRQRLMASAVTTPAGVLTTSFAYDAAGNLTQTTLPDNSFIARAYDAAHRVTKTTDALGNTIGLTLDALSDPTAVAVKNSNGTMTRQHSATFDALGRVLVDTGGAGQTTTLTYDKNGNALTVTDGLNHKTTRVFDALNRLSTSTDANSGVTTLTYDAQNRVTAVKDANGNTTSYVFDGFGDTIGQASPDTGATTYHFDADGNLTSKLDASNVAVNMTYDALDRLLTRAFPTDSTQNATYSYDGSSGADGGSIAPGFLVGRLASRADASGTTSFIYDERGNALSAQVAGVPGGANLSTAYAYDKASRIASVTYPSGLAVGYARDAQGNVSGVTATPPGASTASTVAALGYLPFGPDNTATLGNGVTESRTFDLDYRMTNVTATGTAGALENLTYTLDKANNVTAIADAVNASNSQTLGYDVINRLTSATSGAGGYGSLAWILDKVGNRTSQTAGSVTTTYGYAAGSNRLASITAGSAAVVAVSTNANGDITSIPPANSNEPAAFAYNVANRLSSVTGSPTAASFAYDDWGRRFSKTDTGGNTTTFAYGLSGALLEEATGSAASDYIYVNGRLLGTFAATASSASNAGAGGSGGAIGSLPRKLRGHRSGAKLSAPVIARTRAAWGSGVLILAAGLLLAAVACLRLGRMRIASALTPLALGLVFAACGNSNGGGGGGSPSDAGSEASISEGGTDAGGNASANIDAGGEAGAFDAAADATAPSDGGNGESETGAEGETEGGVTETGVDSGESDAAEGDATIGAFDGGGEEAGGDAGTTGPIGLYYVHADHLGTPQAVTDGSQNVVWSTTYQPYGTTETVTGSVTQNLRFPGQYADSETGFYQNGFRDYMPNVGRYLEADPIGLMGGANIYIYATGNPMSHRDKRGLDDFLTPEDFGGTFELGDPYCVSNPSECEDLRSDPQTPTFSLPRVPEWIIPQSVPAWAHTLRGCSAELEVAAIPLALGGQEPQALGLYAFSGFLQMGANILEPDPAEVTTNATIDVINANTGIIPEWLLPFVKLGVGPFVHGAAP
jgi:RHS repeat-associated protein